MCVQKGGCKTFNKSKSEGSGRACESGKPCESRKQYKMYFLAYFTLQGTLIVLNTLHKVEDHENHARWIYLTTVLNMGVKSEVCEKIIYFPRSKTYIIVMHVLHVYIYNIDIIIILFGDH